MALYRSLSTAKLQRAGRTIYVPHIPIENRYYEKSRDQLQVDHTPGYSLLPINS
jgi:hypothetical protein